MSDGEFDSGMMIGFYTGVLATIFVGILISAFACIGPDNRDALELGYKQYNPQTGQLEWVAPCSDCECGGGE